MRTSLHLMIATVAGLSGCIQAAEERTKSDNRSSRAQAATDVADGVDLTDSGGIDAGDDAATDAGTDTDTSTSTGADGVDPDPSLTYLDDTKEILDAACGGCHGDPASGGAPAGFNLERYEDQGGVSGVYTMRESIASRVGNDSMPPGSPLAAATKTKLLAWIAAGAKKAQASGTGTDTGTDAPTPTGRIVEPSTLAEARTGNSFTVTFQFADLPPGAKFALYYTATQGATTGGTLIVQDQAATATQYVWDSSSVSLTGDYFVYLQVKSATGTVLFTDASSGSVHVVNGAAPTLALLNVFNGSSFTAGTVDSSGAIPVAFDVDDAPGDVVTVKIEYSEDDGASWEEVVDGYAGSSPYSWTPASPLAERATYRFKITATDDHNNSAFDVSDGPVGVTATNYVAAGNLATQILDSHCDSCHAGGASGGFDTDDASAVRANAQEVVERVTGVSLNPVMPQGGMMSSTNVGKVQLWYWQGAN